MPSPKKKPTHTSPEQKAPNPPVPTMKLSKPILNLGDAKNWIEEKAGIDFDSLLKMPHDEAEKLLAAIGISGAMATIILSGLIIFIR